MNRIIQSQARFHSPMQGLELSYNADAQTMSWQVDNPQPKSLKSSWMVATDGTGEVTIYDAIDPFWGFSATEMRDALSDMGDVTVRINSPGGEVFEGIAIYNLLNLHQGKVSVVIDGLAASMASIIALAGDEIQIAEAGSYMIHNPWTFAMGDEYELQDIAEELGRIKKSMVGVYSARTGIDPEELSDLMTAETWYSGPAAVEAGFAESVIPNKQPKPKEAAAVDHSKIRNQLERMRLQLQLAPR